MFSQHEIQILFRDLRSRFSCVFPWIRHSSLFFTSDPYASKTFQYRDMAYAVCEYFPQYIMLSTRILHFPFENILGTLLHEMGHLADLSCYQPGTGKEQLADDLAEYVTGYRIYYDGNDIQTVTPARYPRPLYLHR